MVMGGLDIGTSGCKCTVMRADGKVLSSCYREYGVSRRAGAHEADPAVIWDTAKHVIRDACSQSPEPVQALAVTSFGESVVLLDDGGEPLAPAMLYTDPRGQEQSERLSRELGEQRIFDMCGHSPNAMYSLPKLMYLRETQPELFTRARHILPIHAYIVYRLCGTAVTDYSLAARTMMLDVRKLDWCDELLAAGGVMRSVLPKIVPPGTAAGEILPDLATEIGLPKGAVMVIGCHDQVAAAIGAGALRPGVAVNGSGTVECFTPVFGGIPAQTDLMRQNGYAIVPAVDGLYVTYAFIFTGGALLQWYRDHFAVAAKAEAERSGRSVYAVLDGKVRSDPTGLLVLPHFAGAATPYMDSGAKGAVVGLLLEHDERDLYRALLEGVAYESRVNLERLAQSGVSIGSIRATGGGARSRVWLQIKADILGKPIETLEVDEAGTVGSLMLAGLACGCYATLDQAMALAKTKARIEPAADRIRYDLSYERYKRVYDAVKIIYA